MILALTSPAHAKVAGYDEGALPSQAKMAPDSHAPIPLDLWAGPSILKGQVGVGLGLEWSFSKMWGFEMGAVIPHPVHDYAEDSSETLTTPVSESVSARVKSYGEIHWMGLYTLAQTDALKLDVGLGLSLGLINNEFMFSSTPNPGPGITTIETHGGAHVVCPAPRIQSSLRYALSPHYSLRLSLAYVYYANTDPVGAHSYDLGFNGVLIEPSLDWKF